MPDKPVRGWSTFKLAVKALCRVQGKFFTAIRPRIPAEHLAKFDALRDAVEVVCAVMDTIDLLNDGIGNNV